MKSEKTINAECIVHSITATTESLAAGNVLKRGSIMSEVTKVTPELTDALKLEQKVTRSNLRNSGNYKTRSVLIPLVPKVLGFRAATWSLRDLNYLRFKANNLTGTFAVWRFRRLRVPLGSAQCPVA